MTERGVTELAVEQGALTSEWMINQSLRVRFHLLESKSAIVSQVIAATIGGWSCGDPGPAQFDGSFQLDRLPVGAGRSYKIYAEPLDGPVDAGEIQSSIVGLCRNSQTDSGWPAPFACAVPNVMTNFTTRFRPGN